MVDGPAKQENLPLSPLTYTWYMAFNQLHWYIMSKNRNTPSRTKPIKIGTSLVVLWLRPWAPNAGGPGFNLWSGNYPILHAAWHCQKKKKKKPNKITILICNPTLEPSDREFKITSINRIKALTEKLQCGEQVSNFSRVIVDTQNNQVEILELKNKW